MSHSLASSTGTRVESASKHIVPCKVATDYLMALVGSRHSDNPARELQVLCPLFSIPMLFFHCGDT